MSRRPTQRVWTHIQCAVGTFDATSTFWSTVDEREMILGSVTVLHLPCTRILASVTHNASPSSRQDSRRSQCYVCQISRFLAQSQCFPCPVPGLLAFLNVPLTSHRVTTDSFTSEELKIPSHAKNSRLTIVSHHFVHSCLDRPLSNLRSWPSHSSIALLVFSLEGHQLSATK